MYAKYVKYVKSLLKLHILRKSNKNFIKWSGTYDPVVVHCILRYEGLSAVLGTFAVIKVRSILPSEAEEGNDHVLFRNTDW